MKKIIEFKNMKLEHLIAHPTLDIITAIGFRSCLILDSSLDVLQRHIDSNISEKFYCCAFVDIRSSLQIIKNNKQTISTIDFDSKGIDCMENIKKNTETTQNCNIQQLSKHNVLNNTSHHHKSHIPLDKKRNLLCLGGETGIIKILDLNNCKLDGFLKGHTGAIYDIISYNHVLISCGEDSSIRIWSLTTYECLGVIGGLFGHKDHILSIDIDYLKKVLITSGTDLIIRQWELDIDFVANQICCKYIFIQKPSNCFRNVHNSSIVKVKYYGDIILSLCNNMILAIYNNRDLEILKAVQKECGTKWPEESSRFVHGSDDTIFVGSIKLYDNCKNFKVINNHTLVGISTTGDIYLYDLKKLGVETTPYIIESKLNRVEDFEVINDYIFISTGNAIHKLSPDFSRFEEREDSFL